ncbi:hypothetical protein STCU_11665 [Strigomonas culicis]|uniref:Uncharacterized protein n=1 Tax=Strigomonas culicis TaxID=28005 RepID=S9THW0_9TRYP|nr:hypothetical protein STCU_11665 [Strigomonas culicis]|eukprot:EPY15928.1 hypothetical protein STCU_11665 [Strigomonas culicis]
MAEQRVEFPFEDDYASADERAAIHCKRQAPTLSFDILLILLRMLVSYKPAVRNSYAGAAVPRDEWHALDHQLFRFGNLLHLYCYRCHVVLRPRRRCDALSVMHIVRITYEGSAEQGEVQQTRFQKLCQRFHIANLHGRRAQGQHMELSRLWGNEEHAKSNTDVFMKRMATQFEPFMKSKEEVHPGTGLSDTVVLYFQKLCLYLHFLVLLSELNVHYTVMHEQRRSMQQKQQQTGNPQAVAVDELQDITDVYCLSALTVARHRRQYEQPTASTAAATGVGAGGVNPNHVLFELALKRHTDPEQVALYSLDTIHLHVMNVFYLLFRHHDALSRTFVDLNIQGQLQQQKKRSSSTGAVEGQVTDARYRFLEDVGQMVILTCQKVLQSYLTRQTFFPTWPLFDLSNPADANPNTQNQLYSVKRVKNTLLLMLFAHVYSHHGLSFDFLEAKQSVNERYLLEYTLLEKERRPLLFMQSPFLFLCLTPDLIVSVLVPFCYEMLQNSHLAQPLAHQRQASSALRFSFQERQKAANVVLSALSSLLLPHILQRADAVGSMGGRSSRHRVLLVRATTEVAFLLIDSSAAADGKRRGAERLRRQTPPSHLPVTNTTLNMLCESLCHALTHQTAYRQLLYPPLRTASPAGHAPVPTAAASAAAAATLSNEALALFVAAVTKRQIQMTRRTWTGVLRAVFAARPHLFGEPPLSNRRGTLAIAGAAASSLLLPAAAARPEAATAVEPPAATDDIDIFDPAEEGARLQGEIDLLQSHAQTLAHLRLTERQLLMLVLFVQQQQQLTAFERKKAQQIIESAQDARRDRMTLYLSNLLEATPPPAEADADPASGVSLSAKKRRDADGAAPLDAALHFNEGEEDHYYLLLFHLRYALNKMVHAGLRQLAAGYAASYVNYTAPQKNTNNGSSPAVLADMLEAVALLETQQQGGHAHKTNAMTKGTYRIVARAATTMANAMGYDNNAEPLHLPPRIPTPTAGADSLFAPPLDEQNAGHPSKEVAAALLRVEQQAARDAAAHSALHRIGGPAARSHQQDARTLVLTKNERREVRDILRRIKRASLVKKT